jgi:branched-chain amino acid transport system permease protein
MASLILELFLNGLTLGILLSFVTIGLSLIVGLLRILHLLHAGVFTLGAYIGVTVFGVTGNFPLTVIASLLAGAVFALLLEITFIRRVYRDPEASLILTFALLLAVTEGIKLIWGSAPQRALVPESLTGFITVGETPLSLYRLVVVGVGIGVLSGIWLFLKKTGVGLITWAVLDNREMVESFGIKSSTTLTLVFVLGSAVAALAGQLGSPLFGINPDVGLDVLLFSLVAVVLGGLGNILGTIIISMAMGLIIAYVTLVNPALPYVVIYGLMIIAVLYKPQGLFTRRLSVDMD